MNFNNNKILNYLILFFLMIQLIKCNKYRNGYMYVLRLYTNSDCTGDQLEFLALYENKVYSEILDIMVECDNSNIETITCNYTSSYKSTNPLKIKKYVKTKVNQCSDDFYLDYVKISDFDYDESLYCVLSEYSTPRCEYKPIFHFGILKDICVYKWLLGCSSLGYHIQHCNNLDGTNYKDPYNYTIVDLGSEEFPAYVCKNKIQNYSSSSRGYQVHASTFDGINDPHMERIIDIGPKSNIIYFANSSPPPTLFNFNNFICIILLLLILI